MAAESETAQSGPLPWQAWYPNLRIPEGLSLDDLRAAALLVAGWEAGDGQFKDDEGAWSPVPLVAAIYRKLSAAAAARLQKTL